MNNPFDLIDARLTNIECLLLDIKHGDTASTPTIEQKDEFLTVHQVADLLNLTVPTIYSKASRGELPFMKRAKRIYFSRKELSDYLMAGRKKTNAEIEAEANSYLTRKKG